MNWPARSSVVFIAPIVTEVANDYSILHPPAEDRRFLADVDHFKSVNDTYGHCFGDQVLREVGGVLTECCRTEDIVCRYGGEEFTILLPNTSLKHAIELAERLRLAIEGRPFTCREAPVNITCSFGVANLREQVSPSIIEFADTALYQAKRSGRNRVDACTEVSPNSNVAIE